MRYWILALTLLPTTLLAGSLKTLEAIYTVNAFGADIGESRQQIQCTVQGQCQLFSDTRPTGIARLFTRERLQERSWFTLGATPRWERYEKKKFKDDKLVRTVTLARQKDGIIYIQGPRRFPAHDTVFDPRSLSFVLHRWLTPPTLYIQDDNWQDRMTVTRWQSPEQLDGRKTRRYSLKGEHVEVDIWLDAETNILPIKVRVRNHDTNRTITMTLKEERHTYHAPQ